MIFWAVLLIIIAYSFLRLWNTRRSLPPGPLPIPYIGNMHQLAWKMMVEKKELTEAMRDFVKEYGDVHTFWFGPEATIQICSYDAASEALIKNGSSFVNRALPFLFEYSRELERQMGGSELSIDPSETFELLVGNIINRLMFTDRFEKGDEERFFTLKRKIDNLFEDFEVYDFLINKWTVHLPFIRQRAKKLLKPQNDLLDFLQNQVDQRKKDIAEGRHVLEGEGLDFVDAFLAEIEKQRKLGTTSSFDEQFLRETLLDLWTAGQETTATTMTWAFAYLILNPDVMSKVVSELRQVTHSNRPLSLSDRAATSYYNAVLTEIHRCASIFPMNLARMTQQPTVVGAHLIPAGIPINVQVSLAMSDEKLFEDYQKVIGNMLLRYHIAPDPLHMPSMGAKAVMSVVRKPKPFKMMIVALVFIIIVVFLLAQVLVIRNTLPPGPFPLPIIGNSHQLLYKMWIQKKDFVEIVREYIKEYGSVHTFWFGPIPLVQLCDYATAHEAMVQKGGMFVNRELAHIFELTREGKGILGSNDYHWLEQRRFALHTLRNFGFGRNIIEQRIMLEFDHTCEEIDNRLKGLKELSLNPASIFDLLVANIITRILFTNRFEKADEAQFLKLKSKVDVEKEIAEGTHVLDGEGNDFVDAYLIQMVKDKRAGLLTTFDKETLSITLLDLWTAGQATTTITLVWAFAFLLNYPEVQSRVEEELRKVTNGSRPLSLMDKTKTPYFNATLHEIHRCAAIFPVNLWRTTEEDTAVGKYLLRKGTAVAAQMSLIMTEEEFFPDPSRFDPDRYFETEKLDKHVIPFGLGKRACPGESLARAELYLIIGNFLLCYRTSFDPDHMPVLRSRTVKDLVRVPPPYNIVLSHQ
ncbi:unnamed protein product [Nippostrongylus brasiliensis]|uniref:Cytochrome P450 n=1 Tax=Nippostrongylus brasiliensis TaxID=27835 RepID=A0A0N4Y2S6_NIPBR|nr:unnamed protein product [Nippostrongylus brasiliensis]